VISVTRHRVPDAASAAFLADAEAALDLLRQRPGFVSAVVGRATDDAELWLVATTWADIGSFRRALSPVEVRLGTFALLSSAIDEPTAFERLVGVDGTGLQRHGSDRAPDADTSGPMHVG